MLSSRYRTLAPSAARPSTTSPFLPVRAAIINVTWAADDSVGAATAASGRPDMAATTAKIKRCLDHELRDIRVPLSIAFGPGISLIRPFARKAGEIPIVAVLPARHP